MSDWQIKKINLHQLLLRSGFVLAILLSGQHLEAIAKLKFEKQYHEISVELVEVGLPAPNGAGSTTPFLPIFPLEHQSRPIDFHQFFHNQLFDYNRLVELRWKVQQKQKYTIQLIPFYFFFSHQSISSDPEGK